MKAAALALVTTTGLLLALGTAHAQTAPEAGTQAPVAAPSTTAPAAAVPAPAAPAPAATAPAAPSPQAAASVDATDLPKAPSAPWTGPRVAVGYRLFSLRDWQGGSRVNAVSFSGFLPTRSLRAGGGVDAGTRKYEYGISEGLIGGRLFAGYQHFGLGRALPYLVAVGELGMTFGKRFHTSVSRGYRGIGVELGCDVQLVRGLHAGAGISYMLYSMGGLAYDTFGMRLSIGL